MTERAGTRLIHKKLAAHLFLDTGPLLAYRTFNSCNLPGLQFASQNHMQRAPKGCPLCRTQTISFQTCRLNTRI